MIELNSVMDFVGRKGKAAADIAHTAAFLTEPIDAEKLLVFCPFYIEHLHDGPLFPHSEESELQTLPTSRISEAIRDAIIFLRRAFALVQVAEDRFHIGSYIHGSVNNPINGCVGAFVSDCQFTTNPDPSARIFTRYWSAHWLDKSLASTHTISRIVPTYKGGNAIRWYSAISPLRKRSGGCGQIRGEMSSEAGPCRLPCEARAI